MAAALIRIEGSDERLALFVAAILVVWIGETAYRAGMFRRRASAH